MIQKITKLRTLSHQMDDPSVCHVFGPSLQEKLRKKCNTPVWCLPKTLRCLSQKEGEWCREKNGLKQFLGEYFCVPLDYVVPFFYSCFPFFMDNEFWHLWATASVSWMGSLKYTAHLLPSLCPLLVFINACNKCVTLVGIVIDMKWWSRVIFDSLAAPLFVSLSLGWGKNIFICRFVFRVWRIYCKMTSCLLCAICTVMSSLCQFSSIFPRTTPTHSGMLYGDMDVC